MNQNKQLLARIEKCLFAFETFRDQIGDPEEFIQTIYNIVKKFNGDQLFTGNLNVKIIDCSYANIFVYDKKHQPFLRLIQSWQDENGNKHHRTTDECEDIRDQILIELNRKRCEDCGNELSSCGEMTDDGPSDDCEVCLLKSKIKDLKRQIKIQSSKNDAYNRLISVLTPNEETKQYFESKEFSFDCEHGDDEAVVPWKTIKEIMKSIIDRANV